MQPHRPCRSPALTGSGFSLMELMIAVAIVAILGAVAYPAYLNSVRKGRRSEAVSGLASVQQAQERYRANNSSYATALGSLQGNWSASGNTSPAGYYSLSIEWADGSNYSLAASAAAGTSQASDTNCTTMRLELCNGAVSYGGCNGCSMPTQDLCSAPVTDPNGCWAK